MWVKMVVTWWDQEIMGILDGWIEVEENAGHPGQYMKWYPQQQTPACVPCTPPRGYQARILSQLQAEGDWYLYIPHNGPWTISGGYKTWPPPEGTPGPPPTPITITLRNLTVQNVTPQYLFWDPDNPPEPSKRKITYSLDSVQQTPVNVTIKIFPLSTVETPDPIKTIQESRASPGGPYEYTWDGSTTQGPSAPKGIYPFEIEVAQPQPSDPQDRKISAFLTISGVSASSVEYYSATNEHKIKLDYTLSDTGNKSATELKIRVYDPDFTLAKEHDLSGNSELLTPDSHTVYFPLLMDKDGRYFFIVLGKDDHAADEKAHRNKPALEKGDIIGMTRAHNYDTDDYYSHVQKVSDSTPDASTAAAWQSDLADGSAYISDSMTDPTAEQVVEGLEDDAILYIHNHGGWGIMYLNDTVPEGAPPDPNDPPGPEFLCAKNGVPPEYSLATKDLSNMGLAVFAGCETSESSDLYGNLIEMAVARGAACAMGFHEVGPYFEEPGNDWTNWFWGALAQGKEAFGDEPTGPLSVEGAAHYAKWKMWRKYLTFYGSENYTFVGDSSIKIVPTRQW